MKFGHQRFGQTDEATTVKHPAIFVEVDACHWRAVSVWAAVKSIWPAKLNIITPSQIAEILTEEVPVNGNVKIHFDEIVVIGPVILYEINHAE